MPGPRLQAGHPDVVEVADKHAVTIRVFTEGTSVLYSDHDHLRGEVRVRSSDPPSDLAA